MKIGNSLGSLNHGSAQILASSLGDPAGTGGLTAVVHFGT
jgi:hypothetical protein